MICKYFSPTQQVAFFILLMFPLLYKSFLVWYGPSFLFIYWFFFLPHHAACSILVPWSKTEPGPLAVKTWSPNHWTAREFPTCLFLLLLPLFLLSNPKTHQDWCQDANYLCFFSRSFRVSGLMFKSLIHFELILIHFVIDFFWAGPNKWLQGFLWGVMGVEQMCLNEPSRLWDPGDRFFLFNLHK